MAFWKFSNIIFFSKYWSPLSIMIINDGLRLWHVANQKLPHGILIIFLEKINIININLIIR
jgi:hypothetical protein